MIAYDMTYVDEGGQWLAEHYGPVPFFNMDDLVDHIVNVETPGIML